MLIIGLTGSISTGKSTVASLLLSSAWSPFIFHIDADQIARQVVEPGKPAFREIVDYFGPDILKQQDGTIDREKLGGLIFGDAGKRRKLNGFTHGRILREMVRLTLVALLCGNRVCLWDVPLLIEGGMQKWLPVTIVVFWWVVWKAGKLGFKLTRYLTRFLYSTAPIISPILDESNEC